MDGCFGKRDLNETKAFEGNEGAAGGVTHDLLRRPDRVPMIQNLTIRSLLIGVACTAYGMLSASSSVSQKRQEEDPASGQLVFNNACRTCHTTREGDNRLGPSLHNIVGRKAGSLQNYAYSSAMRGAGFTWDKAKLDGFIANPEQILPGNNMKPFSGLASADDRAKVITFLISGTTDETK